MIIGKMSDTMYHQPVMLEECLQGLNIRPDGVYADLTFGGGGHAKAILSRLTTGKLIAFDQDNDSLPQAEALKNYQQFAFIQSNFRYFYKYLNLYGYKKIDGILADLGISSHQIDDISRGFSIRGNALLDMRMNTSQPKSAKEVLNEYDENRLTTILKTYGEVPNAYKIAQAIVRARTLTPIVQTLQLVELLKPFAPRGKENKFFAQVFQAIRIEVNEEIDALKEMLLATKEALV
ncbi:MAG: 16S rRNA (cytosine(1402)-N(4))-methyltransferase RsmH, partial [Flammeovirgaceae bacterium]|nr:16S rRNA (cytosine(1402)-N(4))-methyltransferase RsmH [Flammeovirgaceae bacterium]MDW8287276.1 16S rRNA (cytosine(1402)-N(4))-methyltransferase RsmH [Flammeovirgaceae bacterium]